MTALEVWPASIPPPLLGRDAWACWLYEADERGHVSKPPYQARSPYERAWPSSPETWAPFAEAYRTYQDHAPRFEGISFALHEAWGIVGIDLDHISEHFEDCARIVEELHSYTEISPSGDGLRVFEFGTLPPGRRVREGVEMYQTKRFLT